jgi:hypothetical protein
VYTTLITHFAQPLELLILPKFVSPWNLSRLVLTRSLL